MNRTTTQPGIDLSESATSTGNPTEGRIRFGTPQVQEGPAPIDWGTTVPGTENQHDRVVFGATEEDTAGMEELDRALRAALDEGLRSISVDIERDERGQPTGLLITAATDEERGGVRVRLNEPVSPGASTNGITIERVPQNELAAIQQATTPDAEPAAMPSGTTEASSPSAETLSQSPATEAEAIRAELNELYRESLEINNRILETSSRIQEMILEMDEGTVNTEYVTSEGDVITPADVLQEALETSRMARESVAHITASMVSSLAPHAPEAEAPEDEELSETAGEPLEGEEEPAEPSEPEAEEEELDEEAAAEVENPATAAPLPEHLEKKVKDLFGLGESDETGRLSFTSKMLGLYIGQRHEAVELGNAVQNFCENPNADTAKILADMIDRTELRSGETEKYSDMESQRMFGWFYHSLWRRIGQTARELENYLRSEEENPDISALRESVSFLEEGVKKARKSHWKEQTLGYTLRTLTGLGNTALAGVIGGFPGFLWGAIGNSALFVETWWFYRKYHIRKRALINIAEHIQTKVFEGVEAEEES